MTSQLLRFFQTRENAEKAIRAINRSLSNRPNQPTLTVYRNGTYEYVDTRETPMLLEVVEFEMVPKGC